MIQSRLHTHPLIRQYYSTAQLKKWFKRSLPVIAARLTAALVLALFFVFIGAESISDVVVAPYFISDMVVAVSVGYVLISYINIINNYLQITYPLQLRFKKRVVQQLLLGILLPSLFIAIAISIYFFSVMDYNPAEVSFFYNEFPISVVVIVALNLFFAAFSFFRENKIQQNKLHQLQEQVYTLQQNGISVTARYEDHTGAMQADEAPLSNAKTSVQKLKTLVAVSGNKNIPITVAQIAYVLKEGNFTKLITFQNESYLLSHTLDELTKVLDDALFFRANRQSIININACHYFTNEENGKLALHLNPQTEDEIIISQKRAAQFKEWLNK